MFLVKEPYFSYNLYINFEIFIIHYVFGTIGTSGIQDICG